MLAAGFGLAQPATGVHAARAISSSCASAPGIKPLIRGLVDRNVAPPAANLDASSINVAWNVLEPNKGGPIAANNPIDVALATAGCTPLRIRVLAGIATPGWVLPDSGTVQVTNPYGTSTTPQAAGRFWTTGYKNDYNSFETLLAKKYESAPNVVEFVVSRCALFYPEPFLLGTSIATNSTSLLAAGYTEAADQQCQQEEIDTAGSLWPATRIGVSFNPYQVITPTTTAPFYKDSVDEVYTEQMMAYCRFKLGSRCVLENDSIRDPLSSLPTTYPQMYSAMSGAAGPIYLTLNGIDRNVPLGAPIAFQTATSSNIGDFWGTLVWARKNHASSVELPPDGTYPTSGGSGAPAWQTLSEVAKWFVDAPSATPHALTVQQGQSTQYDVVATVSVDELAALDTAPGYGDVGSVPFDTITANIAWPTGVRQAGLISIGGGSPATSSTCGGTQASCTATVESAGYVFPEQRITQPAIVMLTFATGGIQYIPADGVVVVANVPVTSIPGALTLTSLSVIPAASAPTARLSAQFTDADPLGTVSDYTAHIAWGDGKVTSGTVTAVGGGFAVTASHRYAHTGKRTVTITIDDSGGATVTGSVVITVR